MKLTRRIAIAATVFFVGTIAHAQNADFDTWMEKAQLGSHQPAEENWDDIIAKAKAEGEVNIYSSSSTVSAQAEDFMKLYPQIKVNAYDLGSEKTIEKVVREHQAGIYTVDVVNTAGTAQMYFDMLPNKHIVNYVPRYLEAKIPKELREPLLTQVIEASTLMYNDDAYKGAPPVTNLWQLTEPEWKKHIAMKSPLGSLTSLALLTTIVEHADDLEAAYQAHTGKKLVLSDGMENAGYEFLHRLLKNELVIYSSGSKLATASGLKGQASPPITFSSMHYINKNKSDDYANTILYDANPAGIFAYSTYVVVAGRAPHPNAAKLFIAFQMGSKDLNKDSKLTAPFREGDSLKLLQGMAAYYQVGTFSPRTDIPLPAGGEKWPTAKKMWGSAEFQRDNVAKVNDFWVMETSR